MLIKFFLHFSTWILVNIGQRSGYTATMLNKLSTVQALVSPDKCLFQWKTFCKHSKLHQEVALEKSYNDHFQRHISREAMTFIFTSNTEIINKDINLENL